MEEHYLCFRDVVEKLCHSMKGQIISRAFYGCKCRFKWMLFSELINVVLIWRSVLV